MPRAPRIVFAASFLAGILCELHGCALAALGVAAACAFVRRDAAIGLTCGLLIAHLNGHPPMVEREARTAQYTGTVVGDVRSDDEMFRFPFAVDGGPTLRATAHAPVHAGDVLRVRARIEPFDEPRNPGDPSARAIALDDGLAGELQIERVLLRAPPRNADPRNWLPRLRERAGRIVRSSLPEPEASILAGALWGERGTLPQTVRDDFQATGTVHILVTAGLHLGVVAALAMALFGLLRVPRIAASLATIPIVYVYALASGWHLPSQRAAAMLSVALIARAAGARAISLDTLAIAAVIVAASWPVAVESVSFALSFSCVGAIVLFAEPFAARFRVRRIPEPLAEALALTCATQIGVWPLTAAVFFTLAPYAVIANAIVVPLVGVTMIGGMALIAASPLPALAGVIARWDLWLLDTIVLAARTIAAFPGARVAIAPPPAWSIVGYDALVIAAATLARRSLRGGLAIIAVATVGVLYAAQPRPPGVLTITTLDVGQGDGTVIRTPTGRTIMIDAGGRLERGATIDGASPAERAAERVVIPYLRRQGIARIDLLIITHPHGDHVGGAAPIINAMPVGMIFDSGQPYSGRAYRDAMAAAISHGVPIVLARRGMHWTSDDGVTLNILAPGLPFLADTGDDVNENSIVVMLRYGTYRELFMGDAGGASESRLLANADDLHSDVVKVGHHGSRYASTHAFVAAVQPRIAVISVGRHNTFGHPAPATIKAWIAAGANILRTDRCGAISLVNGSATTILPCATP